MKKIYYESKQKHHKLQTFMTCKAIFHILKQNEKYVISFGTSLDFS